MIGERVMLTARMTIASSAASAPGEVISSRVGNPVTSTAQEAELTMAWRLKDVSRGGPTSALDPASVRTVGIRRSRIHTAAGAAAAASSPMRLAVRTAMTSVSRSRSSASAAMRVE